MEHGLGGKGNLANIANIISVLILVLMEHGLGGESDCGQVLTKKSLNPCSNGTWSRSFEFH